MSTFHYTKDVPSESTFTDIQSLNKFTEAVSCARLKFNLYYVQKMSVHANLLILYLKYMVYKTVPEVEYQLTFWFSYYTNFSVKTVTELDS